MWKECERVKQKGGATGERNGEEGPGGVTGSYRA